jgi:hypothetical protein
MLLGYVARMLPGLEPKVVDAAPELFEKAEACWLICRWCIVGFFCITHAGLLSQRCLRMLYATR